MLRWYVIQVKVRQEMQVLKALEREIQRQSKQDVFGQILVPTEEVVEIRGGERRKSKRNFFPGYVLLQMVMNDDTWYFVRNISGVSKFIGGSEPTPISDKEAEAILNRIKEGEAKPKPKTLFEVGEVLRVIDGPFADFNGVVEEVNYEKNRLRVAVLIFGRSTPVELEFSQVEKT